MKNKTYNKKEDSHCVYRGVANDTGADCKTLLSDDF